MGIKNYKSGMTFEQFRATDQAARMYVEAAIKSNGNRQKMNVELGNAIASLDIADVEKFDVNEDDFTPKKIIDAIQLALDEDQVLRHMKIVFNIEGGALGIESAPNTVGAKGHKSLATKMVQQTTLVEHDIIPKAIYKLQRLDHNTFLKGGALVEWVLSELPAYVAERIGQAVLAGGVTNEDGTAFTAITPIIGDSLAVTKDLSHAYTGEDLRGAIISAAAQVKGADKTLWVSPEAYEKLAQAGDQVATAFLLGQYNLGATNIEVTDLVPETAAFVLLNTSQALPAYFLGMTGSGIETLSDFVITENAQYIESRSYVAGKLRKYHGAAYGKVAAE